MLFVNDHTINYFEKKFNLKFVDETKDNICISSIDDKNSCSNQFSSFNSSNLTKVLIDAGVSKEASKNIISRNILMECVCNNKDYSKFLKPSELNKIIKQTDFYLKDLTGLKFNPLTSNWYLSDDIDVNYFACIAK